MRKFFAFVLSAAALTASAQDQPQIPNGNFENWTVYSSSNNAPDGWNSYQTALGSMATTIKAKQVDKSEDVPEGSEGKYSAVINARTALGSALMGGNLTTGAINAGAMTPTDYRNNYNCSKITDESKCVAFTGKPESMTVWVKYVPAAVDATYPYAKVTAAIHDDYDYISYYSESNDNETNQSHLVASLSQNIESKDGVWQQLTIPFVYTENQIEPKYILINFYTNATPGKGKTNDKLYIDDIVMNYPTPTGIAEVNANTSVKASKFIKDGKLVIVKDGMQYNAAGQKM